MHGLYISTSGCTSELFSLARYTSSSHILICLSREVTQCRLNLNVRIPPPVASSTSTSSLTARRRRTSQYREASQSRVLSHRRSHSPAPRRTILDRATRHMQQDTTIPPPCATAGLSLRTEGADTRPPIQHAPPRAHPATRPSTSVSRPLHRRCRLRGRLRSGARNSIVAIGLSAQMEPSTSTVAMAPA